MAYQSKYTGLQIDDILDSVEYKQSKIEDLASIRAGAQKGATALQSYTEKYTGTVTGIKLNGIVKSGSGVIDLGTISTTETDPVFSASPAASITEAKKAEWDNKVSKVNGKQLSTEDFTTALKTKLEGLSNYDDTDVIQDLDGLRDQIENVERDVYDTSNDIRNLHEVARSGSYNDLSDKPTIPTAVTENTVSGWGFTKNTGTYSKPSTGIPKSDLASAVQASLGKADTALQSYTEQYKGTVTGVKINGTTKNPSSGVVDLGTVITSHQDISGKQDKLVSGTNIKTINGTSLLGSGNIVISGGGGSSSGSGAYSEVNHGTSDTTFTLTPNTFHVWDEVANLTLTLGSETSGVANEYLFQFTSGSEATTLTVSDDIKWANDTPPTIAENMIYQVSILKGMASVLEFSNKASTITFFVTRGLDTYKFTCTKGMTWEEFINSEYNNGTFAIYTQYNNKIRWSEAFAYGVVGTTPTGVIEEGVTYSSKYGD